MQEEARKADGPIVLYKEEKMRGRKAPKGQKLDYQTKTCKKNV